MDISYLYLGTDKETLVIKKIPLNKWNRYGIFKAACGSGSGQIGIIFPNPEPHPGPADAGTDPYPFQPNVKLNYTFSRKFHYTVHPKY
jgi:hypothetical protein